MLSSLILLAGTACAVEINITGPWGAETEFGNQVIDTFLNSIDHEVRLGAKPAMADKTVVAEPTCGNRFFECSTSYFGTTYTMTSIEKAEVKVAWNRDLGPLACHQKDGCMVAYEKSVSNYTSITKGWSVKATLGASTYVAPGISTGGGVTVEYSRSVTEEHEVTKPIVTENVCSPGYICNIETGTALLLLTGTCKQDPLIVCASDIHPCDEYDTYYGSCAQWSAFTEKHCNPNGTPKEAYNECTYTVPLYQENNMPLSIQIFEQKPLRSKRDLSSSEFDDGSTGTFYIL